MSFLNFCVSVCLFLSVCCSPTPSLTLAHSHAFLPAHTGSGLQLSIFLTFRTSIKKYNPTFSRPFPTNFMYRSRNLKHLLMLNMTIHVNQLMKCSISIKFKFKIQFVTFRRGPPWTPIDPAPVLLSGKHCSTSQSEKSASHHPARASVRGATSAQPMPYYSKAKGGALRVNPELF